MCIRYVFTTILFHIYTHYVRSVSVYTAKQLDWMAVNVKAIIASHTVGIGHGYRPVEMAEMGTLGDRRPHGLGLKITRS